MCVCVCIHVCVCVCRCACFCAVKNTPVIGRETKLTCIQLTDAGFLLFFFSLLLSFAGLCHHPPSQFECPLFLCILACVLQTASRTFRISSSNNSSSSSNKWMRSTSSIRWCPPTTMWTCLTLLSMEM